MVGISFQDQIIPFMSPDLVIKSIFIFISRFFGYYFEKRIVSARIDKVPVVLFFNAFYSIWLSGIYFVHADFLHSPPKTAGSNRRQWILHFPYGFMIYESTEGGLFLNALRTDIPIAF